MDLYQRQKAWNSWGTCNGILAWLQYFIVHVFIKLKHQLREKQKVNFEEISLSFSFYTLEERK